MKLEHFTEGEIQGHLDSNSSRPGNSIFDIESFQKILEKLENSEYLLEYTKKEAILYFKKMDIEKELSSIHFHKDNRIKIDDKIYRIVEYLKRKEYDFMDGNLSVDEKVNELLEDSLVIFDNNYNFKGGFAETFFNLDLNNEAHTIFKDKANNYFKLHILKNFLLSDYELSNYCIKNYKDESELSEEEQSDMENGRSIINKVYYGFDRGHNYLTYESSKRFITFLEERFNGNLPNDFYNVDFNVENGTQKSIIGIALFLAKKFPNEIKKILNLYFSSFKTLSGENLSDKEWNEQNFDFILEEIKVIIRNFVIKKINEYSKDFSDKDIIVLKIVGNVEQILDNISPIIKIEDVNTILPELMDGYIDKKLLRNKEKYTNNNNSYLQKNIDGYFNRYIDLSKFREENEGLYDEEKLSKAEIAFSINKNIYSDINKELKNFNKPDLYDNFIILLNKDIGLNFDDLFKIYSNLDEYIDLAKNSKEDDKEDIKVQDLIDEYNKNKDKDIFSINIEDKDIFSINIEDKKSFLSYILYYNLYYFLGEESYGDYEIDFSIKDLKNIAKKSNIKDINFEQIEKIIDAKVLESLSKLNIEKLNEFKKEKYKNLSTEKYNELSRDDQSIYRLIEQIYHKEIIN